MNSHEINIYGDIVPFKMFNDGSEFDRSDLNEVLESLDLKEGDELIYNLHTFGGCVTTAFSMFNKLKRIKNEKKITLVSRSDGFCASSGVILLLAADKRIGSKYLKPFVHNAWTWNPATDKNEAKKIYEDLEKVDNEIAELYAETTSITKEKALELMNESRDVTIDECLNFGFYTEIENVYSSENSLILNSLRKINSNNRNLNKSKMSKKNLSQDEAISAIDKILNAIGLGNKSKTKNKMVHDATGEVEIDFPDLEASDTPSAGDKATIDGVAAQGEYLMPNGETYCFEAGELIEIKPKEDEDNSDDDWTEEEMNALKEEVKNLKADLKTKDETIGGLKTKNKALNKKVAKNQQDLEEMQEDLLNVKRSIGSNFNHKTKKKTKKEDGESRSLWKDEA